MAGVEDSGPAQQPKDVNRVGESERTWFGGGAYGSPPWGFGRPSRSQSRVLARLAPVIVVLFLLFTTLAGIWVLFRSDEPGDLPPPTPPSQPFSTPTLPTSPPLPTSTPLPPG